ncbi:MAG: PAS domain S-box protein [Chitinophagaceae bacterium]
MSNKKDNAAPIEIDTKITTVDLYHKMIDEVEDYAIIFLDKEGIVQSWNKGVEKIKGYSESDVVGKHFRLFYLPEDRVTRLPEKLLQEATDEGKAIHEGWRLRKDGTNFWGSITLTALHAENGAVIGYSKVTRDLTDRKILDDQAKVYTEELRLSNEALRKSEEKYHQMIEEVQDYAIILLNEQGDIQNWNKGAEKIKGYSAVEIIGKNFRSFYLPADQENALPEQLIANAIEHGKATHEGLRVRKDGSTFWGSIVITALHGEGGAIIGFSKVTRDLTEKKQAEIKMEEYLRELEIQNRELEQFAYVASHDLQEPLRKIRTFTDLIERNLSNAELVKKYFEKINSSAKRMSEQITSILDYSRLSLTDEFREVDLNIVLSDICIDFELLIQEKKAVIESKLLPTIKCIPLQVNQLFANLIGNALKFSNKEPLIKVSSAICSPDEMKKITAHSKNSFYLQILFSDNGLGFEPQYEKQIFSLFQRLHGKDEFAGTGIGLTLCKRIMENHHGFIRASGKPGKGADFYVYFPLS